MTNTNCVKKGVKITLSVLSVFLCILAVAVLSGFIIMEPNVKINGFAELDKARLDNVSKTITVLGNDDEPISDAIYDNNKIFTEISDLPSYVSAAFVAVEDKRFYTHHGVDYLRILSAAKNNIFSGSFKEGASTISQQLIKNTHLKSDKTISRKIQEIRIARDLERNYSKDEILQMYMNILYFGNNIYGIGTAANVMFDKQAKDLTLPESALLAGIINNPSKFNPYTHAEDAEKRRNTVLDRMFEQGYISENDCLSAKAEKIVLSRKNIISNQYINNCISEAEKILGKDKSDIFDGGYTIKSYFKAGLQEYLNELISQNEVENAELNIIVADNESGKFISNGGNSGYDLSEQKRLPGSVIKPILCYAPALELKNVYTVTPILDEKTSFGEWAPSNFNDKYFGWISIEDSLVYSLNVPAVKLLEMNGIEQSKETARKFGIEFNRNDNSLALALGGMTDGVTLNSLTDAYRTFASGGKFTKGRYVKEILDRSGNSVYKDRAEMAKQAISADNAYLITKMLQKCAQTGTAKHVGYSNKFAAAKTGTVGNKQGNSDAYCIAYTPDYTVAVWLGTRDGLLENKYAGGTLPAKLAGQILSYLNDASDFVAPESVVRADIDLTELKNNQKVLLAGDDVKAINRLSALFSNENMPRVYSTPQTYLEKDTILDDFDNFEIIDGVGNQ